MDKRIEEFISQNLGEYKTRGNTISVKVCPFCKSTKDKHTFRVDVETGLYICHRGSCGAKGNFNMLMKHVKPPQKKYSRVETQKKNISDKIVNYFQQRGVNYETLLKSGVKEYNGAIVFEHLDNNGELVCQKIRTLDKKFYITGDASKIGLWLWDKVDFSENYLILTEGEIDALTLVQADYKNVVSLPNGASNLNWIERYYDEMQSFEKIIIWVDSDEPGIKCRDQLIKRLGINRCYICNSEYKDANEALKNESFSYLCNVVDNSSLIEIDGFVKLSAVNPISWADMDKLEINVGQVNSFLGGGLPYGFYSVLSGVKGSGKSAFISNIIVSALNSGEKVFFYSGEMPAGNVKDQLLRIAAGSDYISNSGYIDSLVGVNFENKHDENLRINIDFKRYTSEDLIGLFENAIRRYGSRLLIIDNLMSIKFEGCYGLSQLLEKQDDFCQELALLCKNYAVHVILVQHPAKVSTRKMEMDDIRGSGRITDTASNVIIVHKMDENFRMHNKDYNSPEFIDYNALISIEKNRFGGVTGINRMNFDRVTNRFISDWDEKKHCKLDLILPF